MAPYTFLFVDDDHLFLDLIQHFANEAFPGAEVVTLEDATTVVEVCARQTFDCVVLDHNMPGVSGFETAKRLRAAFPDLPIILVTGAGDEMLAVSALKGGVTDYIPKALLSARCMRQLIEQAIQTSSQKRTLKTRREDQETFASDMAHDNLFRFAHGRDRAGSEA